MMNRLLIQNRRGVTLLFVVSMIVLFLLMGTTFVVVSRNFSRAAKIRNQISIDRIENYGENRGERFVQRGLYELLRGPDLNNVVSPLRGHSILADMYGYGFSSYVKNVENDMLAHGSTQNDQFFRIELIGPDINIFDATIDISQFDSTANVLGNNMLTGDQLTETDLGNAPGRFNGMLLSFVTGPVRGLTTRIIDHQIFTTGPLGTPEYTHKFVLYALNEPPGFSLADLDDGDNGDQDLIVSYDDIDVSAGDNRFPTRVVINGRPFSGTGAGRFNPEEDLGVAALSTAALQPNQTGIQRAEFVNRLDENGNETDDGYGCSGDGMSATEPNLQFANEPYDAFDYQNMFLAGVDAAGNIIPSFHRYDLAGLNAPGTPVGNYSFRPEYQKDMNHATETPAAGGEYLLPTSRSNSNFPGGSAGFNNMTAVPQVDNSGNGINDGIWLDIGIPSYTDQKSATASAQG
ncbi:MAG: hypothetical protein AAGA30_10025 [Planctomycetota bacterium]